MLELLAEGRAFVDLSGWRVIAVSGADGLRWLNDLVSADLSLLATGRAIRSLLLTPTGKVRAEFTVSMPDRTPLLLQDPIQRSIMDLLHPYTLSSDVLLEDRTEELALFAVLNATAPPNVDGAWSRPSCLGPGVDLFAPAADHSRLVHSLAGSLLQASIDDVEAWRIKAGVPRLGVDATEDDLPQEAGLEDAVAFDKGCYLGQEAVAKVRNLGHPRRLLLALEADGEVSRGDPVLAGSADAGRVTSVTHWGGQTLLLARIRWDAREGILRTSDGAELHARQSPV